MEFDSSKTLRVADMAGTQFGYKPGVNIADPAALAASQPGAALPGPTVNAPASTTAPGTAPGTTPAAGTTTPAGAAGTGATATPGATGVKSIG